MIGTSEFKRGGRILLEGEPYAIEDYSVHAPSARGAATLVRCKMRNIVTGILVERTFKAGEKFEAPDVSFRTIQFLYSDGESCHFMDTESYEQVPLLHETLEEMVPWLTEGLELDSIVWNGRVVGIKPPPQVVAQVDMVGAGARTDTASGKNLKEAMLTNGMTIKVPLFIDSGERILVDPATGEFLRRADK